MQDDGSLELIEAMTEEERHVKMMGFNDMDHFNRYRMQAYKGLIRFGGSFARALGETLGVADTMNSVKILRYWMKECQEHAIMNQMAEAKEQAEA